MTFYEAALRVLEEAGAPLHYLEITKRSLDKGLLSHIGKMPEHTMLARLAAQAKRSRERKLVVTSRDTFALSDWMLDEDADALAITGTIEPNAEEGLPPYRTNERHPEPRAEYLRAIGRQAERNRRDRRDDEGKRKKFPPVPEVAFEVLQEAGALVPSELIARLKARDLVDDLGTLALLEALADDNQQRIDQGRRPQFAALRTETNELQLSVDATSPESAPLPLQAQEAFCKAANLPFENGRVVLRSQRRRDEAPATVAPTPEDLALVQTAKGTVKDARRAMARVLRRKLSELETGTFEKACVKLLHAHGFRELKVARRAKDGALLSARKKEGSLELRFAIRMLRGGAAVERRQVQELRRDVSQVSANLGLLLTPGEARGDARAEGTSGGALVMLWCGEHLADKFFEGEVGVSVTRVELFDIDEAFFEQAKLDAEEASKRREERQKDRDGRRDGDDERPPTRLRSMGTRATTKVMRKKETRARAPRLARQGMPRERSVKAVVAVAAAAVVVVAAQVVPTALRHRPRARAGHHLQLQPPRPHRRRQPPQRRLAPANRAKVPRCGCCWPRCCRCSWAAHAPAPRSLSSRRSRSTSSRAARWWAGRPDSSSAVSRRPSPAVTSRCCATISRRPGT
jgi:restriction endonuclease Mrr